MPFSVKRYGTRAKFAKMKRCVKAVKAKSTKVNPYAVCRSSIYHTPYLGRLRKMDLR